MWPFSETNAAAMQHAQDTAYLAKVGTGWSRTVSSQIRKQLDTVISPKSKLTKAFNKPKATWVEPKFFADVEYRNIRSEGCCGKAHSKDFRGTINPECPICFGMGWVCESHPDRVWDNELGCE